MGKDATKNILLRLDPELAERLQTVASVEGRSVSDVARELSERQAAALASASAAIAMRRGYIRAAVSRRIGHRRRATPMSRERPVTRGFVSVASDMRETRTVGWRIISECRGG